MTRPKTNLKPTTTATLAVLTALGAALPTHAAVIEEVVVTAQKREQAVQDVGIAISALTGDQMQALAAFLQRVADVAVLAKRFAKFDKIAGIAQAQDDPAQAEVRLAGKRACRYPS